jgi:hypothetical protein
MEDVKMEAAAVLTLTRARHVMSRNRTAPTAVQVTDLALFLLENAYVMRRVTVRSCMLVMIAPKCFAREVVVVTESVYKVFVSVIRDGQDLLVQHRCVSLTVTIEDFARMESVYVQWDIPEMHVRRSFRSLRAQHLAQCPAPRNVSPVSSPKNSVNTTNVIENALKIVQVVVMTTR